MSQKYETVARKSYSDEDALKLSREIDVHMHHGSAVISSDSTARVFDKAYHCGGKSLVV